MLWISYGLKQVITTVCEIVIKEKYILTFKPQFTDTVTEYLLGVKHCVNHCTCVVIAFDPSEDTVREIGPFYRNVN